MYILWSIFGLSKFKQHLIYAIWFWLTYHLPFQFNAIMQKF